MATKYAVTKHDVVAAKIASLGPLVRPGIGPLSPDAGLTLVLDNGSKHNWVPINNEPVPVVGDYLVTDATLGVTYCVPVAKFVALFKKVAA